MEKYKKSLMGIITGTSLMILQTFGTQILDTIKFRIYNQDITSVGILFFGILKDIITAISLIGMIITLSFSFRIMLELKKDFREK